MNDNNQLIKQQPLAPILAKQEKIMAIEDKLLTQNKERIILNLALEHPDIFIQIFSNYHNLSEHLIEKYYDKWEWLGLSQNESLPWSNELVKKFINKWDLLGLSQNESLPWSIELIENLYSNNSIEWRSGLSQNKSLPWSIELIRKYKDKWNWKLLMSGERIPCKKEWMDWCPQIDFVDAYRVFENSMYYVWTLEEINKLNEASKFRIFELSKSISFPWTIDIIEKYKDSWNWVELSENTSLPWSLELIEKFEDKWYWSFLSKNPSLPWSLELIEKYKDRWENWRLFITQEEIDLLENYKNKNNNWLGLNKEQIEKIEAKIEEIEKSKNTWSESGDGELWDGLSENGSLPWSIELLEKYQDKWNWCYISGNPSVPWSIELIEKYKNEWWEDVWKYFSRNKGVPWSIKLIEHFKDKLNWEELSRNESIYKKTFYPYLTDDLIDEIMQKITEKESAK